MITPQNYFDRVKDIDFSTMPDAIRQSHAFVVDMTGDGSNWQDYYESDGIRETVDMYFNALAKQLNQGKNKSDTKAPAGKKSKEKQPSKETKQKNKPAAKQDTHVLVETKSKEPVIRRTRISIADAKPVEHVDEEVKFVKRYVLLHGKEKTKEQVLSFINSLQKAIVEKRIRKTSHYAEQIKYIQNSLIKVYNSMGKSATLKIRDNVLTEMLEIAGSEKVRLSISYLKRYIGMQGKEITKEKAEKLLNVITGALDNEKVPGNDPYMEKMKKVLSSLRVYVKDATTPSVLPIQEATLAGIQRALDGCGCGKHNSIHGLEGFGNAQLTPDTIMNSMDFAKVQFNTLGFTGKWLELIGDPSGNFTAMVFGKPKMGKSFLCIDFAGYLARNHGKVLYVANEEGLNLTLQEKLNDKNVKHPNLSVTGRLPSNLNSYDFIFLDSVNRLGLTVEDLRFLKSQYPSKSFIYIFQSTKQGNFRGENGFQHDVDVVIEVPEVGKAVQMGRFNQGGEMNIFEHSQDA
jgi:hypothetical protein